MQISRKLCIAMLFSLLNLARAGAAENFETRATELSQSACKSPDVAIVQKAESEIHDLLKAHPDSGLLHWRLAQCYLHEMNFINGQPELLKAVQLDPALAGAWENIAVVYHKEGRLYDAETALRNLCIADPSALTDSQRATAIAALRTQIESELKLAPPPAESDVEYANQADYLAYALRPGAIFWNQQSMPLKVWINTNCSAPGWMPRYVESVKDAFAEWTKLVPKKLSVVYIDDKDKADIVWDWSDDASKYPDAGEAGATILSSANDKLSHADVLLRLHLPHSPMNERIQDCLALHEVGHILGLSAHSPNPRDLMFGAMSAPHIHGLTERDKTTFKRLYSDDALVKEAQKRNPIENIAKLNTHPVTREGKLLQKLAEGGEFMQKGEWLQAIKCYADAHELDSTDKLVLNDLGTANVRQGLELANSGDLDGADLHLQKALKAYEDAGNDERRTAVESILVRVKAKEASLPKPYIALLQKGMNQARTGMFDQAVSTLSDAIKLSPEHAGAWCLRAQCYLQLHKTDAALADAEQALKLEPADSQVLRVRGLVAEEQHDEVEAAKYLSAAVAAEPAGQDVYLDLAALLTHQRKWDKAVDLLTDAIAKHPKCGGCYGSRALSRLALKDTARAISDMQMGLALEPNNAALWFNMGAIDVARDQYSQAVSDFSHAISLKPSDPSAYTSRAGAYKLLKLMDKAREDEATAARLSRNDTALFHVKVGDVTTKSATKSGAIP